MVTKTADYTATTADHIILGDATSASITITLPTAAGIKGTLFHINKIDSTVNTVTVDGNGSETTDGDTTAVLTAQYESIKLISDNANLHIRYWNINQS